MSSPDTHLDASDGHDVVYCHGCQHEWFQDEQGLVCPRCQSEFTEIVSAPPFPPLLPPSFLYGSYESTLANWSAARNDDPRHPRFRLFGGPGPHPQIFHRDPDAQSNEEIEVDQHFHGPIFMRRVTRRSPGSQDTAGRELTDPSNVEAIFSRLTEMLINDFQGGHRGRSGPETLFPDRDEGPARPGNHRATFPSLDMGTASFTIATGPRPAPREGGGPTGGPSDFNAYAPPHRRGAPPGLVMVFYRPRTNRPPSVFGNIMGLIPPPAPRDANQPAGDGAATFSPGLPTALSHILTHLLHPASASTAMPSSPKRKWTELSRP